MKLFALIFTLMFSSLSWAWQPTKPIDTSIGWSPGSGNDVSFRIVSAQVEKMTGAKFIIHYRPGAGGAIANSELVKAPADGYYIGIVSSSSLTATDKIFIPNKTWEIDSFTQVIGYAGSTMAVFAHVDDPVNTIQDLAKVLKTEKVAVGDPGGASRITYELLRDNVGFKESDDAVVHVTYKGNPETITGVMTKEIRFGASPLAVVMEQAKAGKIKVIAVTNPKPLADYPNIPVFPSVYPKMSYNLIWGITAPKGLSPEVVKWYEDAFNAALNSEEVKAQLKANNMIVDSRTLNSRKYTDYLLKQSKDLEPLVETIIKSQK